MLEKFEFKVDRANLSNTPDWLYRTLWNARSPVFNEFIISVSNCSSVADLRAAMNKGGWGCVDASVYILAKLQPSFKVVFRVGFKDGEDSVVTNVVEEHFPLISNMGILEVGRVPIVEE